MIAPLPAVRRLCLAALLVAGLAGALAPPASAGVANAGVPGAPRSNPLAGLPWGVYTGPWYNSVYPAYERSRGRARRLLAKIALRPLMYSFGAWFADGEARSVARDYIASVTGGNPDVLAQAAIFRLDPWEGQACPHGSWSAADQASYRRWIDGFAAGIGSSRVALVLQPDLAFATCAGSRAPLELVAYAARRFNALPHTTVYIDGGVRYWPSFREAVWMLEQAGIRHVRGFALDMSEYDATGAEIEYGARLARALAAAGYGAKHFVINTAENGAGFLDGQYPGDPAHPRTCRNRFDRLCVTLGIPPTTRVAAPGWRLSGLDAGLARRYVDAYVWGGRPWLEDSTGAVDVPRALALAASTPW